MNYKRIHDQIIERAKGRILEGYKEKHHIIPKSLGGGSGDNIVELTAREHFVIHWLLHLIYPESVSISRAFWLMCCMKNKKQKQRYIPSSRIYEYGKQVHAEYTSKQFKDRVFSEEHLKKLRTPKRLGRENMGKYDKTGINNPMHGKTHSDETKRKMSDTKHRKIASGEIKYQKGRKFSESHKENIRSALKRRYEEGTIVNPMMGKKHSEETKRKISEFRYGKKYKKE